MKKRTVWNWLRPVVGLGLVSVLAMAAGAATPRVLLVSVTFKGFRHDAIPLTDEVLTKLAQQSGKFTVDYVKTDAEMAEKMTPSALAGYAAVVFNNTTGELPLPDRDGFLAWIKAGHGFMGIHAATDCLHKFPAYIDMIGGEFKTHGAQVEVEVINQDPKHPACRPYGATFKVFDEIYQTKNFFRNKVHGLLTLDKHPNNKTPGDYPIAWCKNYGQGRVFYTALGHRQDVVNKPEFQQHLLGGLLWALGLEPGDATPQSTALQLSAAEVQAGFQPLFNGVDLKGWKLRNPDGRASWSAQNGMLVNEVTEAAHGTDLVTEEKFRDFTVRYEYMIPKGANSGFYLRGRYEIQIFDDGDNTTPLPTGDGAIYNQAAPAKFASKPAGQWNQVEATIQGNRVTVVLNGVKIHDQVVVKGPTGAQLDNLVNEPGAIFVQGDHGSVAFRNMRIKVLK